MLLFPFIEDRISGVARILVRGGHSDDTIVGGSGGMPPPEMF